MQLVVQLVEDLVVPVFRAAVGCAIGSVVPPVGEMKTSMLRLTADSRLCAQQRVCVRFRLSSGKVKRQVFQFERGVTSSQKGSVS